MKIRRSGSPRGAAAAALLLLLVASACGGRGREAPPEPGQPERLPPALAARRVMVMPFQGTPGVPGPVDDEFRFALEARGDGPVWIPLEELRRVLQMSPAARVPLDDLPVQTFLQAEVTRIGDPLYGILRRAAAITDAEVALIPVEARARPHSEEEPGAVEIRVALIDVVSGRVLWYGVEEGEPGAGTDHAAMASAMEAMARRLIPGA